MVIHAMDSRKQLPGRIVKIVLAPMVSEVAVETSSGILTSFITSRSINNLNLQVGPDVLAVFKTTDVLIAKR